MKKRIGIIGCGNMGQAMARGFACSDLVSEIVIFDRNSEKVKALISESKKISFACSLEDVFKNCEHIILSIKPKNIREGYQKFLSILKEIGEIQGKVLISVAAGITAIELEREFSEIKGLKICRVMPNTPVLVAKGVSAVYAKDKEVSSFVVKLFSSVGYAFIVEKEEEMDLVTAVSGSGPGFVFNFAETILAAAISQGMDKDLARELVANTFLGAGSLLKESRDLPEVLKNKVASPGGTTEAGLNVFKEHGLLEIADKAIEAAAKRSREMSKN